MKLTHLLISAALIAGMSFAGAGDIDYIQIDVVDTVTNVASATTDTGTSTRKVSGWIDTIIINLSGHATPNVDIDITTTGILGTRTLFSIDDIAADGIYPVVDLATTTAGVDIAATPARLPMIGDIITVSVYDSDSLTNVNVSAFFVIRPVP